jgi:hypothetical protein
LAGVGSCDSPTDVKLELDTVRRTSQAELGSLIGADSGLPFFGISTDKEPLLISIKSNEALEALPWDNRLSLDVDFTDCVRPGGDFHFAGLGLYRNALNVFEAEDPPIEPGAENYLYYAVLLVNGSVGEWYDLSQNPTRVCLELRSIQKPFSVKLRTIEVSADAIRNAVNGKDL